MNKLAGIFLTTIVGLSTGVVIGLLLSPKSGKDNRKWVSEHSNEAKEWVGDKGNKIIKNSEQKLGKITKGVKEAIPDLYEATADILFEEEELEENA